MKRIIIHWTAGGSLPSVYEKEHYHYLFDVFGKLHIGVYSPNDNLNCTDGKYAAHTGGGNTGSIGVALCGMKGFSSPQKPYSFAISKIQLENALSFMAGLCLKYGILPDKQGVMTHYEFGISHPKTSSKGKIDIIFLPPYPEVKTNEIGDFLRQKIKWYKEKIKKG